MWFEWRDLVNTLPSRTRFCHITSYVFQPFRRMDFVVQRLLLTTCHQNCIYIKTTHLFKGGPGSCAYHQLRRSVLFKIQVLFGTTFTLWGWEPTPPPHTHIHILIQLVSNLIDLQLWLRWNGWIAAHGLHSLHWNDWWVQELESSRWEMHTSTATR